MDGAQVNVQTVERLRARIEALRAAPRTHLAVLRTGVREVDALLPGGGFPLGEVVELWGSPASGRTRLALRAVAEAHRALRLAAYVDGPGELYPPALPALGVDVGRLFWVRPGRSGRGGWAALQILRSGVFACVVLDLTCAERLPPGAVKRLHDAAARAGGLLLLLTPEEAPGEGTLRLRTTAGARGLHVEVVRSRQGVMARVADVPWGALGRWGAPTRTPRALEFTPGAEPLPAPLPPPFRRPRASDVRNGLCGIQGQRPGRDLALPALDAPPGSGR
ncbi:MAG TPA: recombinase RecA [Myxococcaceae bacterium]|jgi:hypothetical protein|nr:recombinase RecA [Myxococcaceae bacterium]